MFEVITGCMFSGKSEELIRRLRRCQIADQHVLAFKSALDDRYSMEGIASHPHHAGTVSQPSDTFMAIPVRDVNDLLSHLNQHPFRQTGQVIGFDEVQFMDHDIIAVLEAEANRGRRVIVAGLDLDSDGNPFGPMGDLLAVADEVTKLTAVCVAEIDKYDHPVCGKPATRSYRLPEAHTGALVQVGSAGVYEARCRACWARGRT